MSTAKLCPECGSEIPGTALFGLCEKCLIDLAAKPETNRTESIERMSGNTSRRFADYELGRQIGRGGMGVVYEAHQVSLNRQVALKMILDVHVDSQSVRRRFTIEAEAAAKLDHPNIVPIYEVGDLEAQPFISMKLIEGESLKEKIARGELCVAGGGGDSSKSKVRARETAVARFMAAVARAVAHAHQHGILHRDLKPANILVDQEGQPHLTDFGLAKILRQGPITSESKRVTLDGSVLGTPSYMSPEQAGGGLISESADIYSLGAVLYEMLTGEVPFKGSTALETLRLVTDQTARRPSTLVQLIDPDLETICLKCIEKNPQARYRTAVELADDLDRWLRQEPIRARPAGPVKRLTRWTRRNPVGTALIASLLIGLGLALVLLHNTNAQRKRLELMRAEHVGNVMRSVDDLWLDPTKSSIPILDPDLTALGNLEPRDWMGYAEKYTFAIRVNQAPVAQATVYAPFLRELGDRMSALLGTHVVFNLRIYRMSPGAEQPISQSEADFQRMGVLAYLRAKELAPGIEAIARELVDREAVIYARKGSGITSLAQAKGHSAAFGHQYSTLSFLAKVQLARKGVCVANLAFVTNFPPVDPLFAISANDNPTTRREGEMDAEGLAHKRVTEAVLRGVADLGEIQSRYFSSYRYKRDGLVELQRFDDPGDVHVARAGLSRNIIKAFQAAMASFKSRSDRKILERLQTSRIHGFEATSDDYYKEFRSMLTNELSQFETGTNCPVPTKRK